MEEIKGDLIELAMIGHFDIITHGCNCFCTMGSGIAPQIKNAFPSAYGADLKTVKGDINKLGNYSFSEHILDCGKKLIIINSYTQFRYGKDKRHLDYDALKLVLKKINFNFKGMSIGTVKIGAGRAGGNWDEIKKIIKSELKDMCVTIVHFDKEDKW